MALKSIACIALAGCCFFISGCLISKANSTREQGVKVSQSTLNQVKPGETTESWLIATLGEPTSRRTVDEQTSVLRYDHKVVTSKGGAIFLIFSGAEKHEKTKTVLFETKDGVVSRYWTES